MVVVVVLIVGGGSGCGGSRSSSSSSSSSTIRDTLATVAICAFARIIIIIITGASVKQCVVLRLPCAVRTSVALFV